MVDGFELTPMKAFLKHRKEFFVVDDTVPYKRITARLHGQGIVLRDEVYGSQLKTKEQQATKAEDLLVAEIDAKVGGVGIVPAELAGAIVSSHYFLYEIDEAICHPKYLEYYIRSGAVEEQFQEFVRGSTNYASIRAYHALELQIPLPPLAEQRRIVARIEELATLIEGARGLRVKAREEAGTLISSALHRFFEMESDAWKQMPMTEAIVVNDRQVDPALPEYSQLPHISGENIESKTCKLLPYRTAEEDGIKSGNYLFFPDTILYSKIRPYLQKAVFVDFQGVCSADIYPIKVASEELEPRFVMWSLVAGPFTEYANRLSGRTRIPKLNRKQLFAFTLAHPTIEEQCRIVAYLDGLQAQVDDLTALQDTAQAELEALLPSVLDKAFRGEL